MDCVTGVQHIGIPSNQIEESIRFYTTLGFEIVHQPEHKSTVVFLQLGNLMIELYEEDKVAGKVGAINHIALNCTDITTAYQHISALGIPSIEGEIRGLPFWENGVRFFSVTGPNSEIIEFCQRL